MRPVILATVVLLAVFGLAGKSAAQTGEVYVPPGYGASDPAVDPVPPPPGSLPLGTPPPPGTGPSTGFVVSGTVSTYPSTTYPSSMPVVATPTPHMETRTRQTSIRALWIPGLIALPASWLLTWSISSTALPLYGDAIEYSFIPVIGPWLMLTQPLNGYEGFAVTMGLIQDAAAIMLILGLVLREEVQDQVWVMADLGEGRRLTFDGMVGPGSGSMSATLTF